MSFILILIACLCLRYIRLRRRIPLPPGPRGNLFSGVHISADQPWRLFTLWGGYFQSNILSFRIFNRLTIVLNSSNAAHELLNARFANSSDRPQSLMCHDLCDRKNTVFNVSASGSRHKAYRKVLHQGFGTRAAMEEYVPFLELQSRNLVGALMEQPEMFEMQIRKNAVTTIMKIAYGYTVSGDDDFFVKAADETSKITNIISIPGRWLVDYFPILRFIPSWIPGMEFKKLAAVWRQRLDALSGIPHEWVKNQSYLHSPTRTDSFTSRFLYAEGDEALSEEDEDIIKWCAAGLYAGAVDTMSSGLISFILSMALHPEVQRRAQDEIDQVLGPRRLPTVSDLDNLSYLAAVMKEIFRWATIAPLGLPHSVAQEDNWNGYRIPKGSTIVANIWAIMHDENEYSDPFVFKPERFLETGDAHAPLPADPRIYAFGFGRRKCPGSRFAEVSMTLIMAAILSRFSISCGDSVKKSKVNFTSGLTSHIETFKISIVPR